MSIEENVQTVTAMILLACSGGSRLIHMCV
jgi:hypothetical protein